MPAETLIGLAITALLGFLLRPVALWYWRVGAMVSALEKITAHLETLQKLQTEMLRRTPNAG